MEDFWSFVGVVIWTFVFVAYLIVLFHIVTDLFRDTELSGWWKAVWILLLVVIPYLTALVYIITRGRGMTDRMVAAATQARDETDSYVRHVAASSGGASPAEQIATAQQLLDAGTITRTEYDQLKASALA